MDRYAHDGSREDHGRHSYYIHYLIEIHLNPILPDHISHTEDP